MTGSFIVFAMFVFFLKLNKSREKKGQVLDEEMVESRTDTNQVELNGAYQIYEEKFWIFFVFKFALHFIIIIK